MQLHELIENGANKAGSVAELARIIGVTREAASAAKSHKRPLPTDAAVKLAQYLRMDALCVIAANELATEKKEDKRAFWSPFVNHAKAASIALALSLVTIFATPYPAEAASNLNSGQDRLCIMSNRKVRRHSEKRQLARAILPFIQLTLKTIKAAFELRVPQIQGI